MRDKVEIECPECGIKCLKYGPEVRRQEKRGKQVYCSRECAIKGVSRKTKKHILVQRECLWCETKFGSTSHIKHQKCCSQTCASKYSQSFATDNNKEEISKKIKAAWDKGSYNHLIKHKSLLVKNIEQAIVRTKRGRDYNRIYYCKCVVCKNDFFGKTKNVKTCSKKCYRLLASKNSIANPNCGGETNFKRYKYKNITFDSSWEVDIAKWMDEKNIEWIRSRTIMFWWTDTQNKKRRYYPDFYLPKFDIYVDPKNKFLLKKDDYKIKQVQRENRIKILCGLKNDVFKKLDQISKE